MTTETEAAKRPRRKPATRYVLEDQIGFILRQVSQRHATIFTSLIAHDLTPMQFAALAKLYDAGSISQNALGRLTAMDAATIKGVIDRLATRGYIEASPHPDDARLRLLTLTPQGRAALEHALPAATAITEETLSPLSQPERETLLALLRRLR
jgi:DNA-binding MarR family transcriptional regulator